MDNFLANFLLSHVRPLPDDVVNEGKKLFNETRDNEKRETRDGRESRT